MKILIVGATGKMGKTIQKIIKKNKKDIFCGGISRKDKKMRTEVDMVIDFSSPEAFRSSLDWCIKYQIPFLSGTTGLTVTDFKKLKKAGAKIPVFWAANTSVGIQVLKNLLKNINISDKFNAQIKEWHHIQKKDKPSGTALVLEKQLKQKTKNIRPTISVRKGQIVGTHEITFFTKGETITLSHTAHKRDVFAEGALQVAHWLKKQKKGFYSMEDYVSSL